MNASGWKPTQPTYWQSLDDLRRSWTRTIVQTALALGIPVGIAQAADATPPAIPTYYAQADFRLPFDLGPATRRPKQLDLMVSRDGGINWRLHQSVSPQTRAFEVKGAAEGEYLLVVQARDEVSALISQQTTRLVVDHTAPALAIDCHWDGDSRITVQCKCQDKIVDTSTILLRFRCDNAADYVSVPLESLSGSEAELIAVGSLQLPSCQRFELLLSARDRAGNEAQASQKYDLPSTRDVMLGAGDANQLDIVAQTQPTADLEIASQPVAQYPVAQFPVANQAASNAPANETRKPLEALVGSTPAVSLVGHRRQSQPHSEPPVASRDSAQFPGTSSSILLTPSPAPHATQTPSTPQITLKNNTPTNDGSGRSPVEKLVVTERRFSVAYELTPSQVPVHSVELWGTVDQGATWEFWGYDADLVSPCKIEVPALGNYGYCVVVVRDSDDLKLRPQAGDAPDLAVEVRDARRAPLRIVR